MLNNHIEINRQLKRTARDSLIYLPARIVPALIGIILIRIFTTIFTPEEYGNYQITFSIFGLIKVFSMIWLSTSVSRFFLQYKNRQQESIFFSTLFICSILGAIIVAIFAILINIFFFKNSISPSLFSLINLAIIASIFDTFFEIFVMVFRAGLEPKKYSLFWIIFAVTKPFLGVGLIFVFDLGVEGIFWGFLIIPLIMNCFIFFKLELHKLIRIPTISSSVYKQFLRYGIPITFSHLSFWILTLSDRFLIEYFRGSEEVGLYSVGYTISEKTLNVVYIILMLAAYPIIVDSWEKYGEKHTQNLITGLTRYFFFLCVPILITLIVIPEEVLLIFSSNKFIEGARVLPFIAIGVFLGGLVQYIQKGFELHKSSINIAVLALLAGITNIGFNLILIPKFGFLGAGYSATLAYVVYMISAVVLVKKIMPWKPPYQSIFKIIIASFVLAFYLYHLKNLCENLYIIIFLIIPFGAVIFFVSLFCLKEIDKQEIQKGWNFLLNIFKGK